MTSSAPATFEDLGVQGCLHLAALLTAQARRRPIAPTRAMSMVGLKILSDLHIIDMAQDSPEKVMSSPWLVTPMEGIVWRLTWEAYEPPALIQSLDEHLQGIPRDEDGASIRTQLWQQLADGESQNFFKQQLTKHRLNGAWSQDIAYAKTRLGEALSIAQWRYAAWAAVRKGASHILTQMPNADVLREVIYKELTRRAAMLATGQWGKCALPPYQPWPESAQADVFVRHLGDLGWGYWNMAPSVENLRQAWRDERMRLNTLSQCSAQAERVECHPASFTL